MIAHPLQVYVDEAGTDETSPVTIVAAVIVAPPFWTPLNARIAAIKDDCVLHEQRAGYVFHATDLFSGKNGHEAWKVADRITLMKLMLGVFRELDIPFALGACFQGQERADHDEYVRRMYPALQRILGIGAKVNNVRFRHALALMKCLDSVDQFILRCAPAGDTAAVLAEDIPKTRELLANFTELVRQRSDGRMGPKLERIAGGVHFAKKGTHPFLELADALAFTARRYLSRQSFGEELMNSIQPYMTVTMGDWGRHYLSSRCCVPSIDVVRYKPR